MRFNQTAQSNRGANRTSAAFTFAEVLATLLFLAIVIPAAVEGIRLANLAGQLSVRKTVATRIARNSLAELTVTGLWQSGALSGSLQDRDLEYHWTARIDPWSSLPYSTASLKLLTVRVSFLVQGREYDVRLSTLVDTANY